MVGRRAELHHGHTASRHPVCSWLSSLLRSLEGLQGLLSTCSHHPALSCHQEGAVAGVTHFCSDNLSPTTILGTPQYPLLAPHGLLR